MKGKDLVKLIQDNDLEDFEVEVSFTEEFNGFPNIRTLKIDGLADIGYSDNRAILDGELKE